MGLYGIRIRRFRRASAPVTVRYSHVDKRLPQSASSQMLILAAAWTQANYVFEQLTKLHDVLDVQPRVRDADTKPQFTKEQIVKMWKLPWRSRAFGRGAQRARPERTAPLARSSAVLLVSERRRARAGEGATRSKASSRGAFTTPHLDTSWDPEAQPPRRARASGCSSATASNPTSCDAKTTSRRASTGLRKQPRATRCPSRQKRRHPSSHVQSAYWLTREMRLCRRKAAELRSGSAQPPAAPPTARTDPQRHG